MASDRSPMKSQDGHLPADDWFPPESNVPSVVLVIGGVLAFAMFFVSSGAVLVAPADERIDGLLLIFLAVVADCFLSGFIRMFNLLARRFLRRPDIMADIFRKNYKVAANIVSVLFLVPMLLAILRILGLKG
ncbi:MAG: hypothetical protein GXP25_22105 [Planctomycetes bacterium]|nr:hypothetical protein [Planctomycetota bacterium]